MSEQQNQFNNQMPVQWQVQGQQFDQSQVPMQWQQMQANGFDQTQNTFVPMQQQQYQQIPIQVQVPSQYMDQQQPSFNDFGKQKLNFKSLDNEPNNSSGGQIIWRTVIGVVIWAVISGLLFVILTFTSSIFSQALQDAGWGTNPLLPWLLLFIGFLSTFIGNMIIAWAYNMFYAKKYYNFWKMAGFLLLTNAILLLIFFPLYLIFNWDIISLFQLLWFHVMFSIFISANQIEFLSNPNYAGSALMWNVLWLSTSFLLYFVIQRFFSWVQAESKTYLMMLLPPILGFSVIPLFAWIREKIYYQFYSMGSNAFYIPSLSEVVNNDNNMSKEEKKASWQDSDDEINVEMS